MKPPPPGGPPPPPISLEELVARYDAFFIDIYGVLVTSNGALPGAADFLEGLRAARKPFVLVSNDASRLPETSHARYAGFGLPITVDRILTSGMLLADHYARAGLVGARTIVLGTRDSAAYVEAAGGVVVAPDDVTARVLVCADDDGFPFLETMNAAITTLLRRLEDGLGTHLVLPNPDLVFPMGDRAYGLTAGAMAALIEAVLTLRDPAGGLRFVPLGKPHAPLFEAALARSPTRDKRRVVMLGDQLSTDIRGANDFGIDSVLVGTGVGRAKEATAFGVAPTWLLPRLGRP